MFSNVVTQAVVDSPSDRRSWGMRHRTNRRARGLEPGAWTLARTALVLALILATPPARRIQAEPQLRLLATVGVPGANARDWEAMALGVCPGASDRSCLYLGDTGDNGERRDSVAVYVVEEPDPYAGDGDAGLVGAVSLRYPDGPHDAEGLAVTPAGDLVVVTKGRRRPIQLFEIPAPDVVDAIDTGMVLTLREGRVLGLERGEGPRLYATGADLDTGGRVLAVRTYREIHFFEWPMTEPPVRVGDVCIVGFTEPQGEAVGFRNDGWVTTTSESPRGFRGALRAVRCPGIVGR